MNLRDSERDDLNRMGFNDGVSNLKPQLSHPVYMDAYNRGVKYVTERNS